MLNNKVTEICRELIKKELTTLKDLPVELADTIANIYYTFVVLILPYVNIEPGGNSLKSIKEALSAAELYFEDGTDNVRTPVEEIAASMAGITAVTQFVTILRDIDKNTDPLQYRSATELILDYLKYGIEDADKKLLFLRLFERLTKKSKSHGKEIIKGLSEVIGI
ncbi:MAG: hypothetical protein H7844_03360 [Nitrospirae bacterium YQR-1]